MPQTTKLPTSRRDTDYQASYGGSSLFTLHYERDELGRIAEKTETIDGETHTYGYGYDLAGRLAEVRKDGVLVSRYTYDPNGNRLSHETPSGTTIGTYDDQDRLLTYGDFAYTYTAAGELRTKTDTRTGDVTTYVYDELGNLVSVTLPDGTLIEYVIDGENRRVGKKVNGTLVQGFLYENQLRPVAELDGKGNIVSRFVYGTKVNVPEYMVKGGRTYRILTDHLGSPRLVVDVESGLRLQRLDFDEFGNMMNSIYFRFQPFWFSGGISDGINDMVHIGARDMMPYEGRWSSKDPVIANLPFDSLYSYSHNDSVNYLDSNGLDAVPVPIEIRDDYFRRPLDYPVGAVMRDPHGRLMRYYGDGLWTPVYPDSEQDDRLRELPGCGAVGTRG